MRRYLRAGSWRSQDIQLANPKGSSRKPIQWRHSGLLKGYSVTTVASALILRGSTALIVSVSPGSVHRLGFGRIDGLVAWSLRRFLFDMLTSLKGGST